MSSMKDISAFSKSITKAVETAFSGSNEVIHFVVLSLVSSLHVLIEDVPGVGKTTLARAVAEAAGLSFSRIQFTPDMLPGDVLGMNVWNPSKNKFIYKEGPIYSQCILADELNRTSPRTQSAFLEAMQEKQVTIDGITRKLPNPFFMIATQNPQVFTGTFPLPEAELDRFGISFSIGYPSKENELNILNKVEDSVVSPVSNAKEILQIQQTVNQVYVSEIVQKYIIDIAAETRANPHISLGASPRAVIYIQKAAKAHAALNERDHVLPEDVLYVCRPVLRHRIVLSSSARLDKMTTDDVIQNACKNVPIPAGV